MLQRIVVAGVLLACAQGAAAYAIAVSATEIERRTAMLESSRSRMGAVSRAADTVFKRFKLDPVHEEITQRWFGCEGEPEGRNCAITGKDGPAPAAAIAGVRWNDNPPFRLSPDLKIPLCVTDRTIRLPLLQPDCWALLFRDGADRAQTAPDGRPGRRYDGANQSVILLRSHFGDLQFLHAMGTRPGEPARETRAWILRWSEFAWRAALRDGPFVPGAPLAELPIDGFRTLFDRQRGWTIQTLYTLGDPTFRGREDFPWMVFGSLMHLVQDSFAAGHVDREEPSGRTCPLPDGSTMLQPGRVVSFHTYADQDSSAHGDEDTPQALSRHLLTTDPSVVTVGRVLLGEFRAKRRWEEVRPLFECLFELAEPDAPSGPGGRFKRPERPLRPVDVGQ